MYSRWRTKGDLVREALSASMGHAGDVPDTGDLRVDLLVLARAALGFVESPQGMGVLRTLLAEGANPDVRDVAASMLHQQKAAGPRQVFQRAIARGDLAEDTDVGLLLTTIAGALMHRILIEQVQVTDEFLERLFDLVLLGAKRR